MRIECPERGGEDADAPAKQARACEVDSECAARVREEEHGAGGMIVHASGQQLREGELQWQELRIVADLRRDAARQRVEARFMTEDPQRVIGGEGPVGDAQQSRQQGEADEQKQELLHAVQRGSLQRGWSGLPTLAPGEQETGEQQGHYTDQHRLELQGAEHAERQHPEGEQERPGCAGNCGHAGA